MDLTGTAFDTPLRRLLGIEVPIIQAGMAEGARAELVAAVSEAGGLGMLGAAPLTADQIRTEIARIRQRTDKPFGVNLVCPPEFTGESHPLGESFDGVAADLDPAAREDLEELVHLMQPGFVDDQVAACLEEGATVLSSGLGLPARFVEAFHATGGHVLAQVGSIGQARRVADLGVDAVIASGSDAGGHTGRVGSLSLWSACVEELDLPVVASGGITTGRTIAAALVMGCQGVWMGTRFVVTDENTAHPAAKQRIVDADTDDTVVTTAMSGKPMRVIRNDYVDSWRGRESEVLPFPVQLFATGGRGRRGLMYGEVEEGAIQAGQGLGLVRAVAGAGSVVRSLVDETLECLARVERADVGAGTPRGK
jgi:enoyl-[acyl-carrier protein] reductase II